MSKGSSKHHELPEMPLLSVSNIELLFECCCLLPSIKQCCVSSEEQKEIDLEQKEIDLVLKSYLSSNYERTLLLCQYSSAIKYNGEMYGSLNSLHSSSSLVLAKMNDPSSAHVPGFVQKYILVTTILNIEGKKRKCKLNCTWLWSIG